MNANNEQDLRAALRELAAATDVPEMDALEQRLLRAFSDAHQVPATRRSWRVASAWAAAAAVLLTVSSTLVWNLAGHRAGDTSVESAATPPMEFIALPGASSLPDIESGRIIRIEMPPAVLSGYGFDLVSDATAPIEADLLVGQDGLARAIRLASVDSTHRSR